MEERSALAETPTPRSKPRRRRTASDCRRPVPRPREWTGFHVVPVTIEGDGAASSSSRATIRCRHLARRIQPRSAARIAWCRLRCLDRAARSSSFQSASGNRTERTTVVRFLPFPGCPRRSSTAPEPSCGISHRARRDGPPGSCAPANAFRRIGPNRPKSIGPSRGSVVLVARFLMLGSLSCADDPDGILLHLGMHDVEQPLPLRVADQAA